MRPLASQNVEMNGVEKTAGSTRHARATIGITPPTVAAIGQLMTSVSAITVPIAGPYTRAATQNAIDASTAPSARPVRTSLNATRSTSPSATSPTASARVTVVAA